MCRRWLWWRVGLVLLAVPAFARSAAPEADLSARLEATLASPALRRAQVSALVVRASDDRVLFAHAPDRALTPASNQKILTALAVLDAWGPTHRFATEVLSDAPPGADGRVGVLRIRGGGDPALNSEDWWMLAAELRRRGLRRVGGDLILDDSAFDRERWHPGWGRTTARAYHAPVGALTANYGAFSVTVLPGQVVGEAVVATLDPPVPYLRLVNRARTASPRDRTAIAIDRQSTDDGEAEVVAVSGRMRAGDPPKTYYRSVLDPTRYAGAVLRMQLDAVGIRVEGRVRVAGGAAADPPATQLLLRYEGRSLAEIVRLFLKYSNNAVAETLVKALGARAGDAPGSWGNGVPALRARLLRLGLDSEGFRLIDGSGLSAANRLTPRTLVRALLLARRSFRFGPEFVAALPIAAHDGTLEKRAVAAGSSVRAKTGLLDHVTALSGFADLADGELAAFSVLVNGYRGPDEQAMAVLDRFAAVLVEPPSGE